MHFLLNQHNPVLLALIAGAALFGGTYGIIGLLRLIEFLLKKHKNRNAIPMIMDTGLKAKFMAKYKK